MNDRNVVHSLHDKKVIAAKSYNFEQPHGWPEHPDPGLTDLFEQIDCDAEQMDQPCSNQPILSLQSILYASVILEQHLVQEMRLDKFTFKFPGQVMIWPFYEDQGD